MKSFLFFRKFDLPIRVVLLLFINLVACQQKDQSIPPQNSLSDSAHPQNAWSVLKFEGASQACEIAINLNLSEPIKTFSKVALALSLARCPLKLQQLELSLIHKQILSRMIKVRFSPDHTQQFVAETVFTDSGHYEVSASAQFIGEHDLLLSDKSSALVMD